MDNPVELVPGLWLLRDHKTGANYAVVLKNNVYLVVEPSEGEQDETASHAVAGFLEQQNVEGGVKVGLGGRSDVGPEPDMLVYSTSPNLEDLPTPQQAPVEGESVDRFDLPLPGWQILSPRGPLRPLVYSAAQNVVFCGEMLAGVEVPSLPLGGHEYLGSLERLEKLDAKLAMPSRGDPALGKREVRTRIERDRQYIYSVQRHVRTALAAGHTLERTLEAARSAYEDYPFVDAHVINVERVWAEEAGE